MAITKIAKMKPLGIFRDFAWPAGLPDCGRYNLVFGWNWSGKTTLSRMLRSIERRTNLTDAQVTITVDGRGIGCHEFSEASLPIRVFNQDFVRENVFTGGGEISPIFVLGEENVAKQKQIDEMRAELKQIRADLNRLGDDKNDAEKALDSFCITRATIIRDTLRSGGGANPYNNYDKRGFKRRVQAIAGESNPDSHRVDEDIRQRLLKQHAASPRAQLTEVGYVFPNVKTLHAEVSALLRETVVSAVIQSLKEDTGLAGWVRSGLIVHKERTIETCLFCGQGMPAGRIAELEAHFSSEYERLMSGINGKRAEISELIAASEQLKSPNKAEVYPDLADGYEKARAEFQREVDSTRATLGALDDALAAKRIAPFEAVSLGVALPEIDTKAIERVNSVIERHNKDCENFVERVEMARRELENALVVDAMDEYLRLAQKLRDATTATEAKGEEARAQNERIEGLEGDIVRHRKPAEELNEDLRAYLGHDELRLEIEETGYRITRHGEVARGLSEGERTAVALLYFLKSLDDQRFDLRDGIVVLDDPVSSLDSNAIFYAFGCIRERTRTAGQLFTLTHNFTFFRQVRNWFHRMPGQGKTKVTDRPARFYMLDVTVAEGRRCSVVRALARLLERYESEYHYLFGCVYDKAMAPPQEDLRECYFMPNAARRLLEAFLAFRMPELTGNLWQQLQRVEFDEAKKARICRFLHTYSHHEQIGEEDEDLSILSETRAILNDVLRLMQTEDAKHFSAMVSILGAHAASEEGD